MKNPSEVTIRDMEIDLCDVFQQLKKDPKRAVQSKELANIAGKMIMYQKVSMDYANLHDVKQKLPFMER